MAEQRGLFDILKKIAEIFVIIAAIIGVAVKFGQLQADINNIEEKLQTLPERIALEHKVTHLQTQLQTVSDKLATLEKRIEALELLPIEEENCTVINPQITHPPSGTEVNSPATLQGSVETVPIKNHLWIVAYHPKTKGYIDFAEIVPNQNKVWQKDVTLTGGEVGDAYDIDVVLANSEEHKELVKCRQSTQSCIVPQNIKTCYQITITLKP